MENEERRKEKERNSWSVCPNWQGWVEPEQQVIPHGQENLFEPSACSGSQFDTFTALMLEYQFPQDSEKIALISHKHFFPQLPASLLQA